MLLDRAAAGSRSAADEALALVYDELRALAGSLFRDQSARITLQPTALVHEAYLKLIGQDIDWSSRAQFFVLATMAMRSILVDHARARSRAKRGGGWTRVTLSAEQVGAAVAQAQDELDVERIDSALKELALLDERKARLVELRFFGGLSIEEAARVLDIARSTAADDWRIARAWLHRQLEEAEP